MSHCEARRSTRNSLEVLTLTNGLISMSVIPDKGADIFEWIHVPSGIDVLWKSPWGLARHRGNPSTSTNTAAAWIEAYEGGWQVLFPNGGGPAEYKGVELNFHGEASVSAWDVEVFESKPGFTSLKLSNRLARSPFRIEREMVLERDAKHVLITETITNDGREEMDYMWGHHPAFGMPLIGAGARIDTNARSITSDDVIAGPGNSLDPGKTFEWPYGSGDQGKVDLSILPAQTIERATMGYLHDFSDDTAWYGITNSQLRIGAGLAWDRTVFPCAWFWQEFHAGPGFPWYKGVWVMAIEPNTSFPGHGLVAMSKKTAMQRTLLPGESASATITAVLYEGNRGVSGLELDGTVHMLEDA
ncbi:hypothetical protein BH23CHL5_BH23CHL5_04860 [soil metagenome]